MDNFEVYEYSIEKLKDIFILTSNTPPLLLNDKIHLIYFENYFRSLKAETIIVEKITLIKIILKILHHTM